jgi:hypothetical protein
MKIRTKNHQKKVANGFVVCGVLYLVQSGRSLKSEIALAYDFYRDKYRQVSVPRFCIKN